MSSALKSLHSATGTVALVLALLALVASAAGVGYAAATVGTKDIRNNAVTANKIKKNAVTTKKVKKNAITGVKVKDGSLTAADLPAEEAQHAAVLGNGGEGDCVWRGAGVLLAGVGSPTYRIDRFGTVHLAGVAVVANGPGGDGVCDSSDLGQSADAIVFMLPTGYIPAKTVLIPQGPSGTILIAGPLGVNTGSLVLPAGAVAAAGAVGTGLSLDGLSFKPAGSDVVIPKMTASGQINGNVLKALGLG